MRQRRYEFTKYTIKQASHSPFRVGHAHRWFCLLRFLRVSVVVPLRVPLCIVLMQLCLLSMMQVCRCCCCCCCCCCYVAAVTVSTSVAATDGNTLYVHEYRVSSLCTEKLKFLESMQGYMPPAHAEFVRAIQHGPSIRAFGIFQAIASKYGPRQFCTLCTALVLFFTFGIFQLKSIQKTPPCGWHSTAPWLLWRTSGHCTYRSWQSKANELYVIYGQI